MKKLFNLLFLAGFLFTLTFCSNKTTTEKTADDIENAVEDAADEAEDAVEDVADEVDR